MEHAYGAGANEEARRFVSGDFPHRALYEGEDVATLLKVPGVDREAVRDFFARHGLLELFDAIEKTSS